jgi:hypothetical protein
LGVARPNHPRYTPSGHECQNPTPRPPRARANRCVTTRRARPAPRHLPDEGLPRNGRARRLRCAIFSDLLSPAIQPCRRPFNRIDDAPLPYRKNRGVPMAEYDVAGQAPQSCMSRHPTAPSSSGSPPAPESRRGITANALVGYVPRFSLGLLPSSPCALRIEGNDRPETRCRTEGIDRRPVFLPEFLQPARLALSFSATSIRQSHRGTHGQPDQSRFVAEQERFSLSGAPDVAKAGGRVKR